MAVDALTPPDRPRCGMSWGRAAGRGLSRRRRRRVSRPTLLAALLVGVAAGACGDGASPDSTTGVATIQLGCVQPAPRPAISVETVGEAGNEWERHVGSDGVSLDVVVTQRPKTKIAELKFEIAPDGARWPGSTIRHLPVSDAVNIGRNALTVVWDGRDDEGRAVPPGRYHLYATATTTERIADCLHGTGQRNKRLHDSFQGHGMGVFIVD